MNELEGLTGLFELEVMPKKRKYEEKARFARTANDHVECAKRLMERRGLEEKARKKALRAFEIYEDAREKSVAADAKAQEAEAAKKPNLERLKEKAVQRRDELQKLRTEADVAQQETDRLALQANDVLLQCEVTRDNANESEEKVGTRQISACEEDYENKIQERRLVKELYKKHDKADKSKGKAVAADQNASKLKTEMV